MTVTAIILSHFPERQGNLPRIIDALQSGTRVPDHIVVFIDDPMINCTYPGVTVIRSTKAMPPITRFALALSMRSDYFFFVDDDLLPTPRTLDALCTAAEVQPDAVLGFEGNILGSGERPYTDGTTVDPTNILTPVDIVIRTYFVPYAVLPRLFQFRTIYRDAGDFSNDDLFLCLGNRYLLHAKNYVIPSSATDLPQPLPDGGVGQCYTSRHYVIRDALCSLIKEDYAY